MNSITLTEKDIARFWSKVEIGNPDECWECPKIVDPKAGGYGRIGLHGRLFLAHRVSWVIANGRQIPEGLDVLHKCDNRPCVNPKHLFLGTQKENVDDAKAKGRLRKGEMVVISKLKEDDIRRIRELLTSGISTRKIAKKYNVNCATISKIQTGRLWGWLK